MSLAADKRCEGRGLKPPTSLVHTMKRKKAISALQQGAHHHEVWKKLSDDSLDGQRDSMIVQRPFSRIMVKGRPQVGRPARPKAGPQRPSTPCCP